MQQCTQALLVTFGAFCIVCMAGHTFGKILSPLGMPSITLFIFFGLLCGPVGFDLVSSVDARCVEAGPVEAGPERASSLMPSFAP